MSDPNRPSFLARNMGSIVAVAGQIVVLIVVLAVMHDDVEDNTDSIKELEAKAHEEAKLSSETARFLAETAAVVERLSKSEERQDQELRDLRRYTHPGVSP